MRTLARWMLAVSAPRRRYSWRRLAAALAGQSTAASFAAAAA